MTRTLVVTMSRQVQFLGADSRPSIVAVLGMHIKLDGLHDALREVSSASSIGNSCDDRTTRGIVRCYLLTPNGYLLNPFSVSNSTAADFAKSEIGSAQQLFLAAREPQLAQAMVDMGILKAWTRLDKFKPTSYQLYRIDHLNLPAKGRLAGPLNARFSISAVPRTNLYLLVVTNQQLHPDRAVNCSLFSTECSVIVPEEHALQEDSCARALPTAHGGFATNWVETQRLLDVIIQYYQITYACATKLPPWIKIAVGAVLSLIAAALLSFAIRKKLRKILRNRRRRARQLGAAAVSSSILKNASGFANLLMNLSQKDTSHLREEIARQHNQSADLDDLQMLLEKQSEGISMMASYKRQLLRQLVLASDRNSLKLSAIQTLVRTMMRMMRHDELGELVNECGQLLTQHKQKCVALRLRLSRVRLPPVEVFEQFDSNGARESFYIEHYPHVFSRADLNPKPQARCRESSLGDTQAAIIELSDIQVTQF